MYVRMYRSLFTFVSRAINSCETPCRAINAFSCDATVRSLSRNAAITTLQGAHERALVCETNNFFVIIFIRKMKNVRLNFCVLTTFSGVFALFIFPFLYPAKNLSDFGSVIQADLSRKRSHRCSDWFELSARLLSFLTSKRFASICFFFYCNSRSKESRCKINLILICNSELIRGINSSKRCVRSILYPIIRYYYIIEYCLIMQNIFHWT